MNRADLGTKLLSANRLQPLRHWNGLVSDRNERMVIGGKEDGQYENGEREAAVRIISHPGQSDGGVLDALGKRGEGFSWDEFSIGTQVLDAIR